MTATAPALLAPDEPGPVRVLRDGGASDFVLTADHAGKAIPRRLGDSGRRDGRPRAPYRLGHRDRRRDGAPVRRARRDRPRCRRGRAS